jgi:hypothetical protein
MLGHSIVTNDFMEPQGSIPNPQELSNSSYPEPDKSSPHHPIPPLQDPSCSWLQILRSGFDFQHYKIFWEAVGLKRGPLRPVSTTDELLGWKSSGSGLEIGECSRRDPSSWPRDILYSQKLELTSPTNGGRSVSIIRWKTQATEVFYNH